MQSIGEKGEAINGAIEIIESWKPLFCSGVKSSWKKAKASAVIYSEKMKRNCVIWKVTINESGVNYFILAYNDEKRENIMPMYDKEMMSHALLQPPAAASQLYQLATYKLPCLQLPCNSHAALFPTCIQPARSLVAAILIQQHNCSVANDYDWYWRACYSEKGNLSIVDIIIEAELHWLVNSVLSILEKLMEVALLLSEVLMLFLMKPETQSAVYSMKWWGRNDLKQRWSVSNNEMADCTVVA